MLANAADSVVLVVDLQPKFLAPIHQAESTLGRAKFLLQVAALAEVPVFATEQYPERMGGTHESLVELLTEVRAPIEGKMRFSCMGCRSLGPWLTSLARKQVVLVGIETHICVNQTAHQLLELGYQVLIVEDAVSARSGAMHENGIARMRSAGAVIAHSESIAYEWLGAADHPRFKALLELVKST